MISVLLVDDHVSVRTGLSHLLEATDDIRVVATASNGVEAIARASMYCPNVAVMDISMPVMDGIEATRQMSERCKDTRVIMLSIFDHPQYVHLALEVGALGFILKDAIGNDLLAGIRVIYQGKRYFSQKIAAIAEHYLHQKGSGGGDALGRSTH